MLDIERGSLAPAMRLFVPFDRDARVATVNARVLKNGQKPRNVFPLPEEMLGAD